MTRFRLADLTLLEQVVVAVSFVLFGVYVLDPFFLERSKALAPEARNFLRSVTDIGRSNWMLIPAGSLVALALVLRRTHQLDFACIVSADCIAPHCVFYVLFRAWESRQCTSPLVCD